MTGSGLIPAAQISVYDRSVSPSESRTASWVTSREPTHRPLAEQLQLGGCFDPGIAGADHDEGRPSPPLSRIVGGVGQVELADHVVAEGDGGGHRLQAKGMLSQAGYRGQAGYRTGRQNQSVPMHTRDLAVRVAEGGGTPGDVQRGQRPG
jgi:hypothetical protein